MISSWAMSWAVWSSAFRSAIKRSATAKRCGPAVCMPGRAATGISHVAASSLPRRQAYQHVTARSDQVALRWRNGFRASGPASKPHYEGCRSLRRADRPVLNVEPLFTSPPQPALSRVRADTRYRNASSRSQLRRRSLAHDLCSQIGGGKRHCRMVQEHRLEALYRPSFRRRAHRISRPLSTRRFTQLSCI